MKIDLTAPINTIEGEPMKNEQGSDVTLRQVVQTAALATLERDHQVSAEEKVALFNIATEAREDEVDWSPETLSRIRARIGAKFGPAIVGPAFQLLDPKQA